MLIYGPYSIVLIVLMVSLLGGCDRSQKQSLKQQEKQAVRMLPPVEIIGRKPQIIEPSPVVGPSKNKDLISPTKKDKQNQVRQISSD
jgi:hypothetical protein